MGPRIEDLEAWEIIWWTIVLVVAILLFTKFLPPK